MQTPPSDYGEEMTSIALCKGEKTVKQNSFYGCLLCFPALGHLLKFKCVWECRHPQVSPWDPFESSLPTQRVMNVGPLRQPLRLSHYGSALSQPSLAAPPRSAIDLTGCVELAPLWLIELTACPQPGKRFHKAVTHHQMWWSLLLILASSLNSPVQSELLHFTVKRGGEPVHMRVLFSSRVNYLRKILSRCDGSVMEMGFCIV